MRYVPLSAALLLPALVATVVLGCQREGVPTEGRSLGSGVLLIEIDAWRRDRLSLYGYARTTTPALDRWSEQAWVFEDAWSTGSGVLPATASLLSGCDSILSRHPGIALRDGGIVPAALPWQLPESMPRLAFAFLAQGWRTGLFDSSGEVVSLPGVHIGFETMQAPDPTGAEGEHRVERLTEQWSRWLQTLEQGDDWFAYWHVGDLEAFHQVEGPPTPDPSAQGLDFVPPLASVDPAFHAMVRSRLSPHLQSVGDYSAAYDQAVVALDRALGQFFTSLEERRLLGRTTVILVGGYGMGFGENGLYAGAGSLSEVDLSVPLVIRPARDLGLTAGKRVDGLVSLVDVSPTALQLAGIPVPEGWQGVGLFPDRGQPSPQREWAYALATLHEGFAVIDGRGLYAYSEPTRAYVPGLGETWAGSAQGGTARDSQSAPVESWWLRGAGLAPFAFRAGVHEPEHAAELRARGAEWKHWGTVNASHIHRFARPVETADGAANVPALPWAP